MWKVRQFRLAPVRAERIYALLDGPFQQSLLGHIAGRARRSTS
jgi:hypothetical protein